MEHTKAIKGTYLSKEALEAQMAESWQEFIQNESLENPKQPFTKHIVACFGLFKEYATKTEVIALNKTGFYLPQQKLLGFVYVSDSENYNNETEIQQKIRELQLMEKQIQQKQQKIRELELQIHQIWINFAGNAYNTTKFNQEQVETAFKCIYPKLPTLLGKRGGKRLNLLKMNFNRPCLVGNSNERYADKTFCFYKTNQKWGYATEHHMREKGAVVWTLDLVPATQEKRIFWFLYDIDVAFKDFLSHKAPDYAILQAFSHDLQAQKYTLKDPKALSVRGDGFEELLQADTIRANLKPYDSKILSDANRGLWELWEDQDIGEGELVPFKSPVFARNPKADIKEGIVGIDFGTTSSVVVCQEESAHIYPLRIGLGDLTQEIEKNQYENPTIIAFNDLTSFLQAYNAQKGRPKTKWESVKIAHEAKNDMHNSPSNHYNSFFSALKAWAGDKSRKMQILDRQGAHFELKGSLDLSEGDLNPIELYAYYLGLYINNQYNGIFLNYLLSFPVTYELEVREMILESFKKGIAKSMPNALHSQGVLDRLKVEKGASEPAAYAISALEGYDFEPSDEEQVYYGVFDFGGGTTDFDFGLFMKAPEHSRYDYVLEHFGAGGDRYLGGENLLELASFEVFKRNQNVLLKQQIPFTKAAEGRAFAGSEVLLSQSQEARSNTKNLVEKLRPLWEGREFSDEGELALNLFDSHGQEIVGVRLDFSVQEVQELFKERIKRGVDNFFSEFFRATARFFEKKGMLEEGQGINTFHIFLAGNSSKSPLVKELFEAKIAQISEQDANQAQTPIDYKLYAPLESADFAKPNGKTGVAFGLVQARKGGAIQVIDSNVEENIRFKYYLGRSKKRKFYTLIDRDHPYNKWVKFLDASESQFEVYYTTQASAANNHLSLEDHAIKKKSLETGVSNPHAFIFIRLVSPSAFEFVVATDEGLADENYLSSVQKVEL
ncbi:hypothetical protein NHP200010_11410 [Helicobacter bizzozeronii]|uniref:molecular chaperone DnaK n=1 Tax=Helicobacter bizzozeronii TaxID=56877 RepID=UPI00244D8516|nr:molecular chaperone DnaK [Helicobacter bizzozeronii]GMB93422.1 hypothetical protein NHP200010_11410 [Helicobacter bizzozeronii]